MRHDAVIVGGGLAGLAAARRLAHASASVVVLEARDRVGGRTLSTRLGDATIDLGGQWIGPAQPRMARLVGQLRLGTFPTFAEGRRVLELDGRVTTYAGTIPSLGLSQLALLHWTMRRLERMRRSIPAAAPHTAPQATAWDATTVEAWKVSAIRSPAVRAIFDVAVRVVFGAEASELSLLHFLFYLQAGGGLEQLIEIQGGAQETRFTDGAQQVAIRLAAELGDRVVLGVPVWGIRQDAGGVTVSTEGGRWEAERVIVAVPPTLAGRIRYEPALSSARDQLMQRMPMGATIKVVATYPEAFWRAAGLSGEAASASGPLTVTFDNSPSSGTPGALLGFIVGRAAREWGARPADERRAAVLAAFERLFGPRVAEPLDYVEQDWAAEPWTRGCPVGSMPPGTLTTFGPALRAPCGRIHWAGTETASEWNGFMEGAVESGERAAGEVLAALVGGCAR